MHFFMQLLEKLHYETLVFKKNKQLQKSTTTNFLRKPKKTTINILANLLARVIPQTLQM